MRSIDRVDPRVKKSMSRRHSFLLMLARKVEWPCPAPIVFKVSGAKFKGNVQGKSGGCLECATEGGSGDRYDKTFEMLLDRHIDIQRMEGYEFCAGRRD